MQTFSDKEIQDKLTGLNGWQFDGQAIKKDWEFKDFKEAITFIKRVAELAEKHNHHPDLHNVYNQVTLGFYSHDADGITQRDFDIAADIEKIAI